MKCRSKPLLLRWVIIGLIIWVCWGYVWAESINLGEYASMRIERVGKLKGSFQAGMMIREMTGGVSIVLLPTDPKSPTLPIKADRMVFTWEEGRNTPSMIVMEGKVYLEHPEGTLRADKAVWDFKKEMVEFTGNPTLDSPRAQGLRGSKITLDFKNNTIDIENLTADMIPIKSDESGKTSGETTIPYYLKEDDVLNWEQFVQTLKDQAQSGEKTPGKYLLSKFSAKEREQFLSAPNDLIIQRKQDLLKTLNKLLSRADFYDEASWQGTTLSDEVKALLNKKELKIDEQVRLNRLLLHLAFPTLIRPL